MQATTDFVPYYGQRPAPARRWAPWVIVTSAALIFGHALLLILNLMERSLQQRRKTANPPSVAQVHAALGRISAATHFTDVALIAFLIAGITWELKRRTRTRVARDGEHFVEPRLRNVAPTAYLVFVIGCLVSLGVSVLATSTRSNAVSIDDVISYRGYFALSHLIRIGVWSMFIVLVCRATQIQDRREALTAAQTENPFTAEAVGTPRPGL